MCKYDWTCCALESILDFLVFLVMGLKPKIEILNNGNVNADKKTSYWFCSFETDLSMDCQQQIHTERLMASITFIAHILLMCWFQVLQQTWSWTKFSSTMFAIDSFLMRTQMPVEFNFFQILWADNALLNRLNGLPFFTAMFLNMPFELARFLKAFVTRATLISYQKKQEFCESFIEL